MNPELMFADVVVLPPRPALTFAIRCLPDLPTYHELVLENGAGMVTSWVISNPVKHLAKRPLLLWQLAAKSPTPSSRCVETGSVQVVSATADTGANLHTQLARGTLRLTFGGQRLRGHYRLHRLPIEGGQLWQLTPVGYAGAQAS